MNNPTIEQALADVRARLQTEKHPGKLRNLRAHETELMAASKGGSVIATAPGSAIGEAARIRKSLIGCTDSAKLAAGVKRIRELEGRGNLFERKEFKGTPLEKMNALLAMGVNPL